MLINGRSKSWWIVRIAADLVLVDATSTKTFSTGSLSSVGIARRAHRQPRQNRVQCCPTTG